MAAGGAAAGRAGRSHGGALGLRYREAARGHAADPVMAHFYGAVPMAMLTVGPTALLAFGVVYGVPVWGFAMLWLALAAALTARTVHRRLPFALTWWSFTFPVGTCVTGTGAPAARTGADLFRVAAPVLYVGLTLAWLVVAARTARGTADGSLFRG